ncbi:15517_t:CDS:2 [Entrophospora sp. SA101]|nr:15517_t:CDS:2 [Entrophospora sp. SA101]
MRAIENIIQERRLLEEIELSLICNLRYAFQDDENMFMVLDLMLGGDLRFHLERQGHLGEEVVKFYVAEINNVLLDENGHAHLTDFNIAVHYNEKRPLTSVAGSMAYMAPEILKKKGYLNSVDWWSLGVVMYELLFSKRPFRGKTNTALTRAILNEPIHFPENVNELVSEDCIDVLKRFCERDITKRLGCNGIDEIKQHPWFSNIEWDNLVTKQATPPFIPDSKRANFDATHELEELLLEDNPLKARKRANPNQDLSELSKEVRMMEEKFLIYDFSKMSRKSYYKYSPDNMKNLQSSIDSSSANNSIYLKTQPSSVISSTHERQESDMTAVTSAEYKTILPGDTQKQNFGDGHTKDASINNDELERHTLKPYSSAQDINKKSASMLFPSTAHTKSSSLTLPKFSSKSSLDKSFADSQSTLLLPLQPLPIAATDTLQSQPLQRTSYLSNDPLSQRLNSNTNDVSDFSKKSGAFNTVGVSNINVL